MLRPRLSLFLIGLTALALLVTGCFGGITGVSLGTGGNRPGVGSSGQPLDPRIQIPDTDEELMAHIPGEILVGITSEADVGAMVAAVDGELLPTDLQRIDAIHMRLNGEKRSLTDALRMLEGMEGVRFVQPNYTGYQLPYMRASDLPDLVMHTLSSPNDPAYDAYQYGPQRIKAPIAWKAGITGQDTIIAVIDTGVDPDHPDLSGRLLQGINVTNNTFGADDFNGHGTHVAGIAAAGTDDGIGIAGVAPGAWILPLRVFNPSADGRPTADDLHIALAILIAADPAFFEFPYPPADVINLSLGGPAYSPLVKDAVNFAIEQGVVVVAAMGNSSNRALFYPAAYPGVIAVGASDPQDEPASFSTAGAHISVSAPGVSIHSTVPYGNGYDRYSGTSMAAPHVAGAVALLREARPNFGPDQIKRLLESTADPVSSREKLGHGRINVARALDVEDLTDHYGAIEVIVEDAAGNQIWEADVVLFRDGERVADLLTGGSFDPPFDNLGRAVFYDLEPGAGYKVTVRLDKEVHGRSDLESVDGIYVHPGQTTQVLLVF